MKRIIIWSIAVVVIIGSFLTIIFASGGESATVDGSSKQIGKVDPNEWIKGNAESAVELVEYGDFQCPACASREVLIKGILGEFGGHIKFAYRHFPLRSIHGNADISAQAAEAAGVQGKFWEMHDKIFETQNEWKDLSVAEAQKLFEGFATDLGLDTVQFSSDITSSAVKSSVEEDYESGQEAQVDSTPSFFLNGAYIQPKSEEEFRSLIRKAINETTT